MMVCSKLMYIGTP